jgi:ribosomal protein L30/L7E
VDQKKTHPNVNQPIQIAVINASTVLTDSQVQSVVPDLQQQVTRDFYPAWGVDAHLVFIPQGTNPPAGSWWLSILDDSDQAGALGYHDVTNEGLPLGKIFAGTDLKYGSEWTVTASHELLEMLGDPNINLTVFIQKNESAGRLYAYEVCDACEADNLAYKIGNTLVSDFVFPSWFEDFRAPNSTQFDHGRHIHAPLKLAAGGYIGIFDVTSGNGWTQLTDQVLHARVRGEVGTRRERRRTVRALWMRSYEHATLMKRASEYRARVSQIARKAAA